MLNVLLTYLPFRWNKTEKSENRITKMSDSKSKDKPPNDRNSNPAPQVVLKVIHQKKKTNY